jgi:CMP-N-acetylneuraminic acid synthetase
MNRIIADDIAAVAATCYLMTHVTSPLLSATTMKRAIESFRKASSAGRADSLFSATRYQARFYDHCGQAINHDPAVLLRTQDLDPVFEENSLLYIFTTSSFELTGARIGRHPMVFETPQLESIDIDVDSDWRLAEFLAAELTR